MYHEDDSIETLPVPAGVYRRRLNVSQVDIYRSRRLLNYMKCYYRRYATSIGFSPSTYAILESLPSLSFVPSFFLAYTLCRINELEQVTVALLKSHQPIEIHSSKSDHIRQVPPLELFKPRDLQSVTDNTMIMAITYDSLKTSIRTCKNHLNISLPSGCLDCTHIFRHLEATHMCDQHVPLSTISYKLGHKLENTTLKYIHTTTSPIRS
jgi:hypothetical protein